MKGRRLLLMLPVWLYCIAGLSQDIHLSQFNALPVMLNPATTGFIAGDIRVATAVRNQWATVGKGYNSYLLSAEWLPVTNRHLRNGWGVGILMQRDVAGTLNYGQTNWLFSTSFFHSFDYRYSHFLSCGLQFGKGQRGFDPSGAVFGNDRWAGQTEDFYAFNASYFDLSSGIYWEWHPNKRQTFSAGFSVFHLHEPILSFSGERIFLPRRWVVYGAALLKIGLQNGLRPAVCYQQQKKFKELLWGADWLWYLEDSPFATLTLIAGLYHRWGDAAVVLLKLQYKDWLFSVGYDVNFSALHRVSNGYGAVEFSVSYTIGQNKRGFISNEIPCPLF